ncbi:3-dehydroquinate dehydratase I [Candidatus Symbiobacter mobilis CR]|uniref:3-dehydroquinate dehydratase n=2 Tax=Candidatus Symbiobacter TaxID=1436289 RepID=U5N8H4_9BURK|nr:3-dehydroquinate dehydratase I [Candidatus Symbiobacter mobilis CR]
MAPGGGFPWLCTPLVGCNREELAAELREIVPKRPDLLEWRADHFGDVGDVEAVIETAQAIRAAAPTIPLLFTMRSVVEGGQPVALDDEQIVALCAAVCAHAGIAWIDYEMRQPAERIAAVRAVAQTHGVRLLLSFHDFGRTPSVEAMTAKFFLAQERGADVAKIAVMPHSIDDVLALLTATRHASKVLTIPVAGMSMGALGALSRWMGWTCGSALVFVVGASSSAPGQVRIEDMREVLAKMQQTMQPPGVPYPKGSGR